MVEAESLDGPAPNHAESTDPEPANHRPGRIALHLFALTGLVVAQPIYSVYQSNPDIFVARSTPSLALEILTVVIAVVPPLVLAALVMAAGWIRPSLRTYVASFFVGSLVFVLSLQVGTRFNGVPAGATVALGLLIGAASALLYFRNDVAGRYLMLLSPAPVLFAGLFLLTPPMSTLIVPRAINSHGVSVSSSAPVVFMIFDELPQVSLLNSDQEIDRLRYPNIARLADDATWFRNAAAAHPYTPRSISSLLSGQTPDPSRLPIATDYPNSIFTLFGQTHTLHVTEPMTDLCPRSLCPANLTPPAEEARELTRISAQLFQRIVAPSLFDDDVLTLDDPFRTGDRIFDALAANRLDTFRRFVDQINGNDRQFYFGHFFLPHGPYHYLPSGQSYNRTSHTDPGLVEGVWSGDPWHTFDNHQRHLLQVSALDALIGELIGHLESIGAYDETMIVLTSDHGVAHIPEQPRRDVTSATLVDVGLVPLIVKKPYQAEGFTDDGFVQAIDVIPTLAEMLGADRLWPGDGVSVVGGSPRTELLMHDQDYNEVEIDVASAGRAEAIQRVLDRFGQGDNEHYLFGFGPFADLVGSEAGSLPPGEPILEAIIAEPSLYTAVDLDSGFVPAYVSGSVSSLGQLPAEPHLALVLNGVVGAVVPLHNVNDDTAEFGGVVDDSLFRSGPNHLSLLSLYIVDDELVVNNVASNIAPTFSLTASGPAGLESATGERFEIDPDAVMGYVDSVASGDGRRIVSGWAVDIQDETPVEAVAVFIDDEFIVSVAPDVERPDVVEQIGTDQVLESGFSVSIPESAFGDDPTLVRVIGIISERASELNILEPIRQLLGAST